MSRGNFTLGGHGRVSLLIEGEREGEEGSGEQAEDQDVPAAVGVNRWSALSAE